MRSLMIEGVVAIQSGDKPQLIKEKLKGFLPPSGRRAAWKFEVAQWAEEGVRTRAADGRRTASGSRPSSTWSRYLVTFFILLVHLLERSKSYDAFTIIERNLLGTRGVTLSTKGEQEIRSSLMNEDLMLAMDVTPRCSRNPHVRRQRTSCLEDAGRTWVRN